MSVNFEMVVLLVEDSRFVRRSAVKSLQKLGFQTVLEAEDGDEAIKKLQSTDKVDLIVSDWHMPNKDGYELLVWVRANEAYKHIPFIMATARGEKKQIAKATDAGVTDFITKPFSAQELLELIKDISSGKTKPDNMTPTRMQPKKTASGKLQLKVAHIQITDHLNLGVLKYMIDTQKLKPKYFELETVCMPSWNPVQNNLEKGEVDAAFVLAPIAMDMYGFGTPIKLVLLAHKNGSIFVRKKTDLQGKSMQESMLQQTFLIPHELSIHHMISHMFLRGLGLKPGFQGQGDYDVFFEVVPPIQMPEYLKVNPEAGGFLVAEPLGTKAIAEGIAELMFLSGEFWENHPCCVVAMRDEVIEQHPEAVQEFVGMLVEAGQFVEKNPEASAAIGVPFLDPHKQLGLKEAVLRDVLKEDQGISTGDLYPVKDDLDRIQRYMVNEMGLSTIVDLDKFVDTRFADIACRQSDRRKSNFHDVNEFVADIVRKQADGRATKANLNLEGKYIFFHMGEGDFGLNVMGVKEIIQMQPITVVPHANDAIMGVINFRGDVVPVVDLRYKLGMYQNGGEALAQIIVLELPQDRSTTPVGIAVDAVSEVVDIQANDIEDARTIGYGVDSEHILGYVKAQEAIKILLDTDQLFYVEPV